MANRKLASMFGLLVFLFSFSLAGWGQQPPSKQEDPAKGNEDGFTIEATLVTVPVIVTDKKGSYVTDLKQSDFTIFDNDTKQTVTFFDAADAPLHVAVLMDTSFSTSSVLSQIKEAAISFLRELRPSDQAMVLSFDNDLRLLTGLTKEKVLMERAVGHAEIGRKYGTRLHDAVGETIRKHMGGVTGRKAIVLLTDGKDLRSKMNAEQLLALTSETNTVIYTIFFHTEQVVIPKELTAAQKPAPGTTPANPTEANRPRRVTNLDALPQAERLKILLTDAEARRQWAERRNQEAQAFLKTLSVATAGRDFVSNVGDLKQTFRSISDELRAQYTLGFYPESEANNERHALKVEVARPDVNVRSRQNYRQLEKVTEE